MYKRKTKDVYRLIWNGEEIDSFDTHSEAKQNRKEYALAYHCSLIDIVIKKGRENVCL